jgi:catechol 2,3-dioxygenase-like lactoylglutathione lyase family enzyme
VRDFSACVHFYEKLLGIPRVVAVAEGITATFQSGERRFTLLDAKHVPEAAAEVLGGAPGAPRATLVFTTDDVDKVHNRLREAGVVYRMTPRDFPQWGVRSSVCLDPDGNPVEIAAPLPRT